MLRSLFPALTLIFLLSAAGQCQEPEDDLFGEANSEAAAAETSEEISDPASPSAKIVEALEMIRRVEEYDKLAKELERLKAENERLHETIAKLQEERTKQTTALPVIAVRSKGITAEEALAVLEIGDTKLRVRSNSSVMVSLNEGEATPLQVKEITPDSIELEFPELNRSLILNE